MAEYKNKRSIFLAILLATGLQGSFVDTVMSDEAEWHRLDQEGLSAYQQGNYTQAIQLFESALQEAKATFGSADIRLATGLNWLAASYDKLGRYSEAEPLYLEALEIVIKVFGSNHQIVGVSIYNLALRYSNQGRYSESGTLYRRASEI